MFCHLDMDCFYAAIEMRERPELAHKPLAIGGESRRGVVTTCNYVARARGVRSAMPGFMARQLCPEIVFLPVRFSLYQEESQMVFDYISTQVSTLERTSVDEAYFEVSDNVHEAWDFCARLRAEIQRRFGITCSIGMAPNKMLAKIMSGHRKPNAQLLLRPFQVEDFMKKLDVRKIPGIGPKAEQRFLADGIRTCGDLQKYTADELAARHGHWGLQLFDRCRGRDSRKLSLGRERKSFSCERTLMENITSENFLLEQLRRLYKDFHGRLGMRLRPQMKVEKVFVRFKFSDFRKISHEIMSVDCPYEIFEKLALEAYRRNPGDIRLIGLGVRFDVPDARPKDPRQLALWDWSLAS